MTQHKDGLVSGVEIDDSPLHPRVVFLQDKATRVTVAWCKEQCCVVGYSAPAGTDEREVSAAFLRIAKAGQEPAGRLALWG